MTDAEREIYSRCSVILTHLLNRLVFGDSHDFLLFEHEVSQAQRDEQPLKKLNVGGCTSSASRRYETSRRRGRSTHRSL